MTAPQFAARSDQQLGQTCRDLRPSYTAPSDDEALRRSSCVEYEYEYRVAEYEYDQDSMDG